MCFSVYSAAVPLHVIHVFRDITQVIDLEQHTRIMNSTNIYRIFRQWDEFREHISWHYPPGLWAPKQKNWLALSNFHKAPARNRETPSSSVHAISSTRSPPHTSKETVGIVCPFLLGTFLGTRFRWSGLGDFNLKQTVLGRTMFLQPDWYGQRALRKPALETPAPTRWLPVNASSKK